MTKSKVSKEDVTEDTTKEEPCKCLELVNDGLQQMGSNTRVCVDSYVNLKTGDLTTPKVRIAVEKADRKKRERLKPIFPSFCPFCGKRY